MANMQSWVKQLFSSTDKLFDILNVGRLIFYTAAGLLAVYPLLMTVRLLVIPRPESFFASLGETARSAANPPWLVFFAALVVGFLIAKVGFTTIIQPVFAEVSGALESFTPRKYGFNYRYPQLKNEKGEDYQAWLMAEYFRYVEIATFIPLGLAIGLVLLGVHTVVYLLTYGLFQTTMTAIYPALVFLLGIAVTMGALSFHVWPTFWRPRVLTPTVRTYVKAKISLIEGYQDFVPRNASDGGT